MRAMPPSDYGPAAHGRTDNYDALRRRVGMDGSDGGGIGGSQGPERRARTRRDGQVHGRERQRRRRRFH